MYRARLLDPRPDRPLLPALRPQILEALPQVGLRLHITHPVACGVLQPLLGQDLLLSGKDLLLLLFRGIPGLDRFLLLLLSLDLLDLRLVTCALCDAHLPEVDREPGQDRYRDPQHGESRRLVAPRPLLDYLPGAVLRGRQHAPLEVCLDVRLQRLDRLIALAPPAGHRPLDHRLQLPWDAPLRRALRRRDELPLDHLLEHVPDRVTLERRLERENLVENRPQPVDIGPVIQLVCLPGSLLGRYVRRRAHDRPVERQQRAARPLGDPAPPKIERARSCGRIGVPRHLGQAPVHHLHLAELPDHQVGRLEVSMDHTPAMGKRQGVADLAEDAQQLDQRLAPGSVLVDRQPSAGRAWPALSAGQQGALEPALLGQHTSQVLALHTLHREVDLSV